MVPCVSLFITSLRAYGAICVIVYNESPGIWCHVCHCLLRVSGHMVPCVSLFTSSLRNVMCQSSVWSIWHHVCNRLKRAFGLLRLTNVRAIAFTMNSSVKTIINTTSKHSQERVRVRVRVRISVGVRVRAWFGLGSRVMSLVASK